MKGDLPLSDRLGGRRRDDRHRQWRDSWAMVLAALFASGLGSVIGVYSALAVAREDLLWVEKIQNNHELRLEALEIGSGTRKLPDPQAQTPPP